MVKVVVVAVGCAARRGNQKKGRELTGCECVRGGGGRAGRQNGKRKEKKTTKGPYSKRKVCLFVRPSIRPSATICLRLHSLRIIAETGPKIKKGRVKKKGGVTSGRDTCTDYLTDTERGHTHTQSHTQNHSHS